MMIINPSVYNPQNAVDVIMMLYSVFSTSTLTSSVWHLGWSTRLPPCTFRLAHRFKAKPNFLSPSHHPHLFGLESHKPLRVGTWIDNNEWSIKVIHYINGMTILPRRRKRNALALLTATLYAFNSNPNGMFGNQCSFNLVNCVNRRWNMTALQHLPPILTYWIEDNIPLSYPYDLNLNQLLIDLYLSIYLSN